MSSNAPPPQESPGADKRPCPKCGAANPVSAEFCWQCLSALNPVAPATTSPPPDPTPPDPTPPEPPAASPPTDPPPPADPPPLAMPPPISMPPKVDEPVATPAGPPSPYSAEGNPFRPGASAAPPPTAPPVAPAASGAPNPYSKEGNPFRPGASAAESVGLEPGAMPTTNELDKQMPLLIGMGQKEREPSTLGKVLRVAIPLVVGVAAFYFGWQLFGGSSVEIPQEISGITRLENTFTEQIQEVIDETLGNMGVEVSLGVFGSDAVPSFMVLVLQGDNPPSPEQNFQNFATGFAEGAQGASIDTGEIQRRDFNGVTYLCAPGEGAIRAVCLWQREDVVGIVSGFDRDLAGTFQMTIAAYEAIQGEG